MENRIREFRRQRHLTLQEVADTCGLSKGYLSKIERADTYPPFSTLQAIAQAMRMDLEDFFGRDSGDGPTGTDRAGNIEVAHETGGAFLESAEGYAYEPLLQSYKNKYMAPFKMRIPPGRTRTYSHDAEEFVYVLKGRVALEYEDHEHALEAGGCFYLDSRRPHVFVNSGSKDAELLAVNFTYKRF